MAETEAEVPSILRATEIFNRMRKNPTFVGQDIEGSPLVSTLQPGEQTTITLHIPLGYFPPIDPPLHEEETALLIQFLLGSSQYSDRSRIAQAGGMTELVTHAGQPSDMLRFENIVRRTQNGYEVDVTMTNLNPVRAIKFPSSDFKYVRLYIPGAIEPDEEVARICQLLAIDSSDNQHIRLDGENRENITEYRPASIQIDIRRFARYTGNTEPISVESLNPADRTELDSQIGLDWNASEGDLRNNVDTAHMIIGETCGIRMPEGYTGIVILGSEDDHSHQHSIIIDPGFTGPFRTEHRMLPGSPMPRSVQLFLYKV